MLNFPNVSQIKEADYLGVESGYHVDKLSEIGYTTTKADTVDAPVINEMLLSLECEVVHTVTVGSHTQVTGEVKRIIYDEEQVRYLEIGKKMSDAFKPGAEMKKALSTMTDSIYKTSENTDASNHI